MDTEPDFGDVDALPVDGPVAWGDDLRPATLLAAYRQGVFPWPTADGEVWWWSPDPRAVIPLDGLHVSRSLRRRLRSGAFTVHRDTAFREVVAACAAQRAEGTWITDSLADAVAVLHDRGHAHSIEVRDAGTGGLVGGIYGLAIGGAFMGESMFHRADDASKVALVGLVDHLRVRGFSLFDVQLPSAHLATMGAVTIARRDYLRRLRSAVSDQVSFGSGASGISVDEKSTSGSGSG